jgi:hypothetical protein
MPIKQEADLMLIADSYGFWFSSLGPLERSQGALSNLSDFH